MPEMRHARGIIRPTLFACGLVSFLLLVACSAEPGSPFDSGSSEATGLVPNSEGGAAGEGRPLGGRITPLFISPAGQPFHGAADGPPPVTEWFAQADADHDGKLTRPELVADYDHFFRTLDTNGDGVIDGFEQQAYERKIAPELLPQVGRLRAGEGQDDRLFKGGHSAAAGRNSGRGGRGGGGFEGAKRSGTDSASGGQPPGAYQFFPDLEPIAAADSDLDGKVTLSEWRARAKAVFNQLDTKEAGFLRLETLPKTPQQAGIEKRRAEEEKRRSR